MRKFEHWKRLGAGLATILALAHCNNDTAMTGSETEASTGVVSGTSGPSTRPAMTE